MGILRESTQTEKEFVLDLIPYALESKITNIRTFDSDTEYFNIYQKQNNYRSIFLYKGIPSQTLESVISDGRLLIEKGHRTGYYGKGIYFANDITYAANYGSTILIVEVTDGFLEHLCYVKKESVSHDLIENLSKGYCGFHASDCNEDTHEDELIVTNNDAMRIRYVIDYIK